MTPYNCPKPAEEYKAEHAITEADFNARDPKFLICHDARYVERKVALLDDCDAPIAIGPAGNMETHMLPGAVYYPAGLFKALLAGNAQSFEMFATQDTEPPFRKDIIMQIGDTEGTREWYDFSSDGHAH